MPNHFREVLYPAFMIYAVSLIAAGEGDWIIGLAAIGFATFIAIIAIYDDYREGRAQESQDQDCGA